METLKLTSQITSENMNKRVDVIDLRNVCTKISCFNQT